MVGSHALADDAEHHLSCLVLSVEVECDVGCCRFCMGSNKVLQVALGREESDEYKQNISQLANRIKGKIGLFFTKLPQEEVRNTCNVDACHVFIHTHGDWV